MLKHWSTITIGHLHSIQDFEGYSPDRAEHLLLHPVELATQMGAKSRLVDAHRWLAELYQTQGKWEQAHRYVILYHHFKEEVQSHEAHKKAEQLKHLRQIAELEKQRAIEQAEARAAEEIQRMKGEQTERELGNATLQLLAQTELLRDLRNDLLTIARMIPPSEPGARELRERVKNLPCESVDWDRFDRQFRAVHPDFIRRLTGRAPDLSATEVRICTMLRMNLRTQEMAQIFCITESGVEFHRKNIRKKLKLGRDEKLPIVLGAM